MAMSHALSGEIVDVRPLGAALRQAVTTTLIKTGQVEVIRLVVPEGKEIPHHKVAGEIVVQCLEGMVTLHVEGQSQALSAGHLMYLRGDEMHAVRGVEDASLLVTILLTKPR